MEQPEGKSMNMVFVLVISAILLAIATFVALNLVSNRSNLPAAPELPQSVMIDGVSISLDADPDKAVYIEGEAIATPLPTGDALTKTPGALSFAEPTAAPTVPPPTATPVPDPVIFVAYRVSGRETLYSIAELQNSSIELMAVHGIDSDDLVAGNVLQLPVANPAYCPGSRPYVVRDRDTVFRIAVAFNTTPEVIGQMNNLDANYTIYTAQVLCVPS